MICENIIEYKGYKGALKELVYLSPGTGYRLHIVDENGADIYLTCVKAEDIKINSAYDEEDLPF